MTISVSVVVLAWGEEPTLERCVDSVLASRGVEVELIVVDNGATPATMERLRDRDIIVVGPPVNRGFTGGCNVGVERTSGPVVVMLNSDAFVEPDAIVRLAEVASEEHVGIASASLRLADEPDTLNSAGNPVHFSGITWSGAYGQAASDHATALPIASATGAAMAMRRDVWNMLGGFDEEMFAYLEDTELSLRTWLAGLEVRYVPDAVVLHAYEFGRHELKFYLLERNRVLLLATLFRLRTLVLLAPALVMVEFAMVVQSITGGWFRSKLRTWWWLASNLAHVRERRAVIAGTRRISDRELMTHLVGRIEPDNVERPPGLGLLNFVLDLWWRLARRLVV